MSAHLFLCACVLSKTLDHFKIPQKEDGTVSSHVSHTPALCLHIILQYIPPTRLHIQDYNTLVYKCDWWAHHEFINGWFFFFEICNICHCDPTDLQKGGQINIWHQAMQDIRQAVQKPENPEKSRTYDHPTLPPLPTKTQTCTPVIRLYSSHFICLSAIGNLCDTPFGTYPYLQKRLASRCVLLLYLTKEKISYYWQKYLKIFPIDPHLQSQHTV